jgi:hypothetical protein
MFTVSQFRKCLPPEYQSLSDDEVEKIRNGLYGLANIIFDKWKKDKNLGKESN